VTLNVTGSGGAGGTGLVVAGEERQGVVVRSRLSAALNTCAAVQW
jgi:hypothetical protein